MSLFCKPVVDLLVLFVATCILIARFRETIHLYLHKLVTDNHFFIFFVPAYCGVVISSSNTLLRTATVVPVLKTIEI